MRTGGVFLAILFALPLLADKYHLNPTTVVPAATGEVNTDHDNNGNTTIDLKVEHLAKPGQLTPAELTYIVWVQGPGSAPENAGNLKIGDDLKGELKTVTPLKNFELFITAESDPRIMQPRGPVVMRSNVHPGGD